mmetsp:Transcript_37983/g.121915  ORF Transcript_37983/g.121915 Transcript_37983/m.121915 type:complete len:154 (-) Transcript_37983:27-488(-)
MWESATSHGLSKANPWYDHALPFEYEQRALHFFAKSDVWTRRKHRIPQYDDNKDAGEIRRRVKVLPQCALNSYLLRPSLASQRPSHQTAAFAPGDFIVHLAGHKAANKAALFDYALHALVQQTDDQQDLQDLQQQRHHHHTPRCSTVEPDKRE